MTSPLFRHNEHLHLSRLHHEEDSLPQIRLGRRSGVSAFDRLTKNKSPWHESKEDVEAGLKVAREDRVKLARVRLAMYEVLNEAEFDVIELHYFNGLSLRQVGRITDRNASTVHRRIRSAIIKLRRELVPGT